MSPFNPGPGWHQVENFVASHKHPKQRLICVYRDDGGAESYWIEDLPVELPTIAGAYIAVQFKEPAKYNSFGGNTFVLSVKGPWIRTLSGSFWTKSEMLNAISSYETLYLPRM